MSEIIFHKISEFFIKSDLNKDISSEIERRIEKSVNKILITRFGRDTNGKVKRRHTKEIKKMIRENENKNIRLMSQ